MTTIRSHLLHTGAHYPTGPGTTWPYLTNALQAMLSLAQLQPTTFTKLLQPTPCLHLYATLADLLVPKSIGALHHTSSTYTECIPKVMDHRPLKILFMKKVYPLSSTATTPKCNNGVSIGWNNFVSGCARQNTLSHTTPNKTPLSYVPLNSWNGMVAYSNSTPEPQKTPGYMHVSTLWMCTISPLTKLLTGTHPGNNDVWRLPIYQHTYSSSFTNECITSTPLKSTLLPNTSLPDG